MIINATDLTQFSSELIIINSLLSHHGGHWYFILMAGNPTICRECANFTKE